MRACKNCSHAEEDHGTSRIGTSFCGHSYYPDPRRIERCGCWAFVPVIPDAEVAHETNAKESYFPSQALWEAASEAMS